LSHCEDPKHPGSRFLLKTVSSIVSAQENETHTRMQIHRDTADKNCRGLCDFMIVFLVQGGFDPEAFPGPDS